MKTALKTLALAAALLAPAPVLAQAAAGSVPNSFDAPAAQATPAPQRPGQAPVQAPAAAASTDVAEAEAALILGHEDAGEAVIGRDAVLEPAVQRRHLDDPRETRQRPAGEKGRGHAGRDVHAGGAGVLLVAGDGEQPRPHDPGDQQDDRGEQRSGIVRPGGRILEGRGAWRNARTSDYLQ